MSAGTQVGFSCQVKHRECEYFRKAPLRLIMDTKVRVEDSERLTVYYYNVA